MNQLPDKYKGRRVRRLLKKGGVVIDVRVLTLIGFCRYVVYGFKEVCPCVKKLLSKQA